MIDYQLKEGSQPREGRKMTMGRMKDYIRKGTFKAFKLFTVDFSAFYKLPGLILQREGRKITKGRKEVDQGKEGR